MNRVREKKKVDEMIQEKGHLQPAYYVGIGASAGGLEALQDFFKHMPDDTGMVFIVVQHLSPDYKSLMHELLARCTKMAIKVVEDGMTTEANTIYLIPPRKNMSIFHGKLFLEDQRSKKSLNLPIDIFLRSLAADKEKLAIGIILSGTGSDGALGIRAVKGAGGMIMVQDDQSAKFDGMPRSSIATGLVDFVLSPDKMPEALIHYIKHPFIKKGSELEKIMAKNIDAMSKITLILRDYCGIDFSYYKENTITRRLERRVGINRFNTLQEYMLFLSESDKEKEMLFRELLIGVTRFFRDQEAFDALKDKVLPSLDYSKKVLRVWSTGCSSGEEVYSAAMMLEEYISQNNLDCTFKIFASDIDRYALEIAGQGLYPESIIADVPPEWLNKYFTRKENGYLINENIRKKIVFATHNLLKDPPFSKLDLLICRNLFIYLKPDMQQKVLSMFYHSLNEKGFLFMGSSESIGDLQECFETIDTKWKMYQPKMGCKPRFFAELSVASQAVTPYNRLGANRFTNVKMEKVFESIATVLLPPSILIDTADNILHLINDVNPYLTYRSGRFSANVFANLNQDLVIYVSDMIRKLKGGHKDVVVEGICGIAGFEDKTIALKGTTLCVDKIDMYLVSILAVETRTAQQWEPAIVLNAGSEFGDRIHQLEQELRTAKENLQATVEELETSNEELQSSNEELIASNEELQSTNEELQSVNEELYTVNSEYQNKIDELIRVNNDLDNLLKNTDTGAIYLDRSMCIRKITSAVTKITNILPTDIGRPISHISLENLYKDFLADIETVIDSLQSMEKEIEDAQRRRWIVQIRPYRSEYNAVDGIMVTFINVTKLRLAEEEKRQTQERLNEALRISNIAWWEWDIVTQKVIFDPKKATMLGYTVEEFPDNVYAITDLLHPDDYEATMNHMRAYLEGKTEEWNVIYRIKRRDGTYAWYHDRGRITARDHTGRPLKLIGTVVDVSEIKRLESQLRGSGS